MRRNRGNEGIFDTLKLYLDTITPGHDLSRSAMLKIDKTDIDPSLVHLKFTNDGPYEVFIRALRLGVDLRKLDWQTIEHFRYMVKLNLMGSNCSDYSDDHQSIVGFVASVIKNKHPALIKGANESGDTSGGEVKLLESDCIRVSDGYDSLRPFVDRTDPVALIALEDFLSKSAINVEDTKVVLSLMNIDSYEGAQALSRPNEGIYVVKEFAETIYMLYVPYNMIKDVFFIYRKTQNNVKLKLDVHRLELLIGSLTGFSPKQEILAQERISYFRSMLQIRSLSIKSGKHALNSSLLPASK